MPLKKSKPGSQFYFVGKQKNTNAGTSNTFKACSCAFLLGLFDGIPGKMTKNVYKINLSVIKLKTGNLEKFFRKWKHAKGLPSKSKPGLLPNWINP